MSRKIGKIMIIYICCNLVLVGCITLKDDNNTIAPNGRDAESVNDRILHLKYDSVPEHEITLEGPITNGGLLGEYTALEDENTEEIPVITSDVHIDYPLKPTVVDVADGIIVVTAEIAQSAEINQGLIKYPVIYKINKEGEIQWSKNYPYEFIGWEIGNVLVCHNGNILISIQNEPVHLSHIMPPKHDILMMCDSEGNELWHKEYPNNIAKSFEQLLMTDKGNIIAVGQCDETGGKAVDNVDRDIVITFLDQEGNIIKQKIFGGSKSEFCQKALWDGKIGLVIIGWTLSDDGEFASVKKTDFPNYLACLDEELELQWVRTVQDKSYEYEEMIISNHRIYIPLENKDYVEDFMSKEPLVNTEGRDFSFYWQVIDQSGQLVKEVSEPKEMWGWKTLAVLKDRKVVTTWGNLNSGEIIIYTESGEIISTIALKYTPRKTIATMDGGFIIYSSREKATLPNSMLSSSIIFDTETIIAKYNAEGELLWRKTWDDYEEKEGEELLYVVH